MLGVVSRQFLMELTVRGGSGDKQFGVVFLLVQKECTTLGKSLGTDSAHIRPLPSVDPHVAVVRVPATEFPTTEVTGKAPV